MIFLKAGYRLITGWFFQNKSITNDLLLKFIHYVTPTAASALSAVNKEII
jgi:hypothetical protein